MAGVRAALVLLVVCAAALTRSVQSQLVIEQADRKIDVSSFRAVYETKLKVRNDGSAAADSVVLCLPTSLAEHSAILEAGTDAEPGTAVKLRWTPASPEGAPAASTCRSYALDTPLAPGASLALRTAGVVTHVLRPEPAKIKQNDPQRVVYKDTAQIVSPYKVEKQMTEIDLGTSEVSSFTRIKPSKRKGHILTYGPYTDNPPFTSKIINVHYENNSPFAQVTELERDIQVSHWGNVYFEEQYSLRHAGPKVTGEWSRFDLMVKPQEYAKSSINMLAAMLPPSAHSLYYRDGIGNISSSDTHYAREAVGVKLVPRYPLFGGWSTRFKFGWSLPLKDVVLKDPASGRSMLVTNIGPSIRDVVVDRLVVKVVLPEGATDPKVTTELTLSEGPTITTSVTYLDVLGRPTVELVVNNFVQEMNLPLRVEYNYSSAGLLQKPLLLVAAFGAIFLAAIVLNRGSTSLASSSSPKLHAA